MSHRGSCICGDIRFEVTGDLGKAVACHCAQCRKGSGHFVVATAAPAVAISVEGTPRWFAYKPGVERGFCGRCGAQLFWRGAGDASVSIFMGAFDGATGLRIDGHIYVAEKGDYYEIDQGLPAAAFADPILTTRQT
ncbi:MAG: GFA family protein [Pseudomonadota bacterium]